MRDLLSRVRRTPERLLHSLRRRKALDALAEPTQAQDRAGGVSWEYLPQSSRRGPAQP